MSASAFTVIFELQSAYFADSLSLPPLPVTALLYYHITFSMSRGFFVLRGFYFFYYCVIIIQRLKPLMQQPLQAVAQHRLNICSNYCGMLLLLSNIKNSYQA